MFLLYHLYHALNKKNDGKRDKAARTQIPVLPPYVFFTIKKHPDMCRGALLWRRTRDSNPRGSYALLAFQASSLATRSILRIAVTCRTYQRRSYILSYRRHECNQNVRIGAKCTWAQHFAPAVCCYCACNMVNRLGFSMKNASHFSNDL